MCSEERVPFYETGWKTRSPTLKATFGTPTMHVQKLAFSVPRSTFEDWR